MADVRIRPIMLVCAHCGHHDLDGDELLEIDFRAGQMMYICRHCSQENKMHLKASPIAYPKTRVQ